MHLFDIRKAGQAPFKASFREARMLRVLIYLVLVYALLLAAILASRGRVDLPGGEPTRRLLVIAVAGLGLASIAIVAVMTFRPSNWILRVIPKGVLVNLAPFGLGRRPPEPSVLFLEPREIEWAGPQESDRRCLGLRLAEVDWREIEDRIAEVGGPDPSVKLLHGRLLLIRWKGRTAWVLPGMEETIRILAGVVEKGREPPARRR